MSTFKKQCLIVCFGMASFLSAMAIDEPRTSSHLDNRLVEFMDFAKDLHQKELLDGEVWIVRDGQTLLHLMNPSFESQCMIGSVSKQFFAVALLKALYEGGVGETEELKIESVKKKLHAPLSQFLPKGSAVWGQDMPAWADEISLHHLLTHTSGVPNYTAATGFLSFNGNQRWDGSFRSGSELIGLISKEPLQFAPGSKYDYSNTGYVLIAEVIESITSTSVSDYLQKELFDRLGLMSTASPIQGQWSALKLEPRFKALAAPYKYDPCGNQSELYPLAYCEDISVAKGAGSIISTSTDLLKWNQSLHRDQSVLPKALYQLLITPNLDCYGYGIGVEKSGSGLILGHGGGIGTYRTLLFYLPEYDLSFVVLSNVCCDYDKIEAEFKKIEESLKGSVPEELRFEAAQKLLFEKYPISRGFDILPARISQLFHGP